MDFGNNRTIKIAFLIAAGFALAAVDMSCAIPTDQKAVTSSNIPQSAPAQTI